VDSVYVDPTLPPLVEPDHIELLHLLSDICCQQAMGNYARPINKTHLLICWTQIEEFKCQEVLAWKKITAREIFDKYISPPSLGTASASSDAEQHEHQLQEFSKGEIEEYRRAVESVEGEKEGDGLIDVSAFAEVQQICFMRIYDEVFLGFRESTAYESLQKRYNKVSPHDFEYFNVLGKGTSGVVVHARKKSTRKHYAIKIIRKADLVHEFRNNIQQMDIEVRVLSRISHPFIVGMDYSFQTPEFGMIVMELVTGGSLRSIPAYFRKGVVPEKALKFYVAQISEALHYLHSLGTC
jgi:hypothetical protein